MKVYLAAALVAVVLSAAVVSQVVRAADAVPCEQLLVELQTATQGGLPSGVDEAALQRLESEGVARCTRDDDAGADAFFHQALALLGR